MDSNTVGIGLRKVHYREVIEQRPPLGFVEVHSENFFVDGGAALAVLERARALYPVSLHGVGLSLGSADTGSVGHLCRLKQLVDRIEPALVSEHLCWGAVGGVHFNDLLPLPYTEEALALLSERVDRAQEVLGRRLLVENISAYVEYRDSAMSETAFLAALTRRTGCAILFDVNNLYVNTVNFGGDAAALMDELPAEAIGQFHLAGHLRTDDGLIDHHGSRVAPEVWALYRRACQRVGARPTLIEWDTELPPLAVLLDEARTAAAIQAECCEVGCV
jgi:hypothetical protein